jgi:uncharacterized membrane protein YhfC
MFFYILIKGPERNSLLKIFGIGVLGWTIAFFIRIIPLSVLQQALISYFGIPEINSNLIIYLFFILWGPLFAAVFEEPIRYICARFSTPLRIYAPLMLGLGWTTAEIVLLYLLPILNWLFFPEEIPWLLMPVGVVERILASIFHLSMSFLAFYAIKEQWPKKVSLWLALIFHFILNYATGIFIWIFKDFDELTRAWGIEILLTVVVVLIVLFTFKSWIPRIDSQQMTIQEINNQHSKTD